MVEHFGHLTQRPSGISFFFDLELESFGFLTKVVVELAGGGVTAGSILSSPKDFFVNDAVAMGFRDLIVNVPENYFRTENTKSSQMDTQPLDSVQPLFRRVYY